MTVTAGRQGAMADAIRLGRNSMHIHLMQRIVERNLPIDYADVIAMEARIARCRPAFEVEGQIRYRLRLKLSDGRRIRVIYDSHHGCLLTAWAPRPVRFPKGKRKRA